MKKLFSILFALIAVVMLSSCCFVSPDADEETVLVKKPWFFGHGGVDNDPVQSGLTWCALSTHSETFKIVPVRHEVVLDDIFSDDNTPLDFHSVIVTQVEQGKSPILLQNYGRDWFDTNLYNYFCNLIRDHISQYSPFDLMSNRQVLSTIDKKILKQMQDYVAALSKHKPMPESRQSTSLREQACSTGLTTRTVPFSPASPTLSSGDAAHGGDARRCSAVLPTTSTDFRGRSIASPPT